MGHRRLCLPSNALRPFHNRAPLLQRLIVEKLIGLAVRHTIHMRFRTQRHMSFTNTLLEGLTQ